MGSEVRAETLLGVAMDALALKRPISTVRRTFSMRSPGRFRSLIRKRASAWRSELLSANVDLDLLIDLDGTRLGVELKYPRRGITAQIGGELFTLSTGADDHGRYLAVEDLVRLERLVAEDVIDSGVLVLLTNVANVWAPPASRRRVLYNAFRMHDGRILAGAMTWGDSGAQGGRPPGASGSVTLAGTYPLT